MFSIRETHCQSIRFLEPTGVFWGFTHCHAVLAQRSTCGTSFLPREWLNIFSFVRGRSGAEREDDRESSGVGVSQTETRAARRVVRGAGGQLLTGRTVLPRGVTSSAQQVNTALTDE